MLPGRSLLYWRCFSNVQFATLATAPASWSHRQTNRICLRRRGLLRSSVTYKIIRRTMVTSFEKGGEVEVQYRNGFPVISVVLPSHHEKCLFTLHPLFSTIGQFLKELEAEDSSITESAIYTVDGDKMASSTQMQHVLKGDFTLKINDSSCTVQPPPTPTETSPWDLRQEDVKHLLRQMYGASLENQDGDKQEQSISNRLKDLKAQLEPLEQVKNDIEAKARSRTTFLMWGGLAYMAVQFGVLARLTWWEYSWDIMEPVTYFITYATTMAMYGYFILTKQEYLYPDARDRQHLRFFHKAARNSKFDVEQYNALRAKIFQTDQDLRRLRDTYRSRSNSSQEDGREL